MSRPLTCRRALLALSDERDQAEALRLAAWREGFAAGRDSMADEYERGLWDGVLTYKAHQHNVVTDLRCHLATWDGPREDFGKPRPGDYPGRLLPDETSQEVPR